MIDHITNAACVYLVKEPSSGFYKIGHAANFRDRLSGLATGLPHALEPIDVIPITSHHIRDYTEKCLHILLQDCHVIREWYQLADDLGAWKAAAASVVARNGNIEAYYSELLPLKTLRTPRPRRRYSPRTRPNRPRQVFKPATPEPQALRLLPAQPDIQKAAAAIVALPGHGSCVAQKAKRLARQDVLDRILIR